MAKDGLDELEPQPEPQQEAEEGEEDLAFLSRFSAFIIDGDTYPALFCPNGHVTEWRHKQNNHRLAGIYRFEEGQVVTVCFTCGADGPVSERLPDGAQETTGD